MQEFDETADDLRYAFKELQVAGTAEPRHRRALKAVLNELYRVQEYRLGRKKVHRGAYFAHAKSCDAGKVTLGVTFLRGVLTHHLIKQVQPTTQLQYPSEDAYPGKYRFPGTNFVWITGAELSSKHTPDPGFAGNQPYYNSHVGGQMMLPTLEQAIDFLLTDPVVVTFEYI